MEHHTNYDVTLTTETEYKNLYEWCLQEFDNEGKQVGRDLIPYEYFADFKVTNLRYELSLEHRDQDRNWLSDSFENDEIKEQHLEVESSEVIHADLVPAEYLFVTPSYSMIGTNRKVDRILLKIYKAEKAYCKVFGFISYSSEVDFHDVREDDFLQVSLGVSPDNFNELARIINSNVVSEASLRLSNVMGFYSQWSPRVSTNSIKILTSHKDDLMIHGLEDAAVEPPRLGTVEKFSFHLGNSCRLEAEGHSETSSVYSEWAKQQTEDCVKQVCEDSNGLDGEEAEDGHETPPHTFNEERARRLRHTRKYKLLSEMFVEASTYAEAKNLESYELSDLSDRVTSLLSDLEDSFNNDWETPKDDPELAEYYVRRWDLWEGQGQDIQLEKIAGGEAPYIDRDTLNQSVANYVALPIRSQGIERMLVDALVAMEVIAYGDEMLNAKHHANYNKHSATTSPFFTAHPLKDFLVATLVTFVIVALIPIAVLFGIAVLFDANGGWLYVASLGFSGLWVLLAFASLLGLPAALTARSRLKRETSELLAAMSFVHTAITSGVVVSARHIRERLEKTSDQGAVWPAEIFVLLDDIVDRGKRISG